MSKKNKLALQTAATTTPAPEGTDWIPEDALESVRIEESAEAEVAPNKTTW